MKKKKVFTPILVNAAEMARQYPDTFEQPPKSELDKLQRGDLAQRLNPWLPRCLHRDLRR